MSKKYYSKEVPNKLKPTPLEFNVYFRGANGHRSEKLRQEHRLLLLQRKRAKGQFSRVPSSKVSKRNPKNQRNQSTYQSSKVKSKRRKHFAVPESQKFLQTGKGIPTRNKIGGKFNMYEYKKHFQRKNPLSKFGINTQKMNQWGEVEQKGEGTKGGFEES